MSEIIYKLDPDDGSVVDSFSSPGNDPEGLAWDGQYLWHVDGGNAYDLGDDAVLYIYKIDPSNGNTVYSFEAPGPGINAEDLTWDGSYLWYVDGGDEEEIHGTSSIYKIDPQNGNVLMNFDAPASNPSGLTWDGTNLVLSDYIKSRIYFLNPLDGNVVASLSIDIEYPGGLAWDGQYLWCADWDAGEIFCLEIDY